jgi:cation transport regulator
MPYLSVDDLPPPVRNNLPRHAQKIFKDAFNSAYAKHHGEDEVTSFKIAWAAVKKKYEKRGGKWVKKAAA